MPYVTCFRFESNSHTVSVLHTEHLPDEYHWYHCTTGLQCHSEQWLRWFTADGSCVDHDDGVQWFARQHRKHSSVAPVAQVGQHLQI